MDWDEELKRQAAISALLAPPEAETPPDVVETGDKSDYHKAVNSAFDTKTDEQVTGQDQVYPTIAEDQDKGPTPRTVVLPAPRQVVLPASEEGYSASDATVAGAPPRQVVMPAGEIAPEDTVDRGERGAPLDTKVDEQVVDTPVDEKGMPLDLKPQVQPLDKGEAPAKLTQVERGELVGLPWHPAAKPNVPGIIADSDNAILNPAAGVTPPTPVIPPKYPDQIVTPDEAAGKTSVVNAPPAAAQPKVVPSASKSDWESAVDSLWPSKNQPPPTAATNFPRVQTGGANLKGTDDRITEIVSAAANALPEGYTVRPTSGVRTAGQGQHTLGKAQDWQIFDPQGNPVVNRGDDSTGLYTLLARNAYGYQEKYHPELTGQFQWGGQFGTSTANNPNEPDLMHFDIGGRRGRIERYSRESIGAELPPQVADAAAKDTEPPINTLVKLDQSGLNVTQFGYQGDPYLDSDSAKGQGKWVEHMIPGYDVALNAAARAMVGNPEPGQTFQFAGREWRYGDQVPEKYNDARFDIYSQDGTALSGQTPVGKAVAAADEKPADWQEEVTKGWTQLPPDQQAKMESTRTPKEQTILADLQKKIPNLPEFMRVLDKPIDGVSEEARQRTQAEFKKEITAYAQDYYKESDPAKAYAMIMKTDDFSTLAGLQDYSKKVQGEILSKIIPNFMHAGLSVAQQATSANPLMQFINVAQPDASPKARLDLVNKVMAQSGDDRANFIKALYSHLGSDQAQNVDLNALLNWSDTMAQPGVQAEQARQQQAIQAAIAQNRKDLRTDPTLEHTLGGTIASVIASAPKNVAETLIPVIGQSAMFSEIYSDTLENLRADHKDWSEDQLKAKAAAASIPQDMLQELINIGTLGLGAGATRGITNPLARIATNSILHGTVTGSASAGQQMLANVSTGRPLWEGVQEAGIAGTIPGLAGGAAAGLHGVDADAAAAKARSESAERFQADTAARDAAAAAEAKTAAEAKAAADTKAQADAAAAEKARVESITTEPHGPPDVTLGVGEHGPAKPLSPVRAEDILGTEDERPLWQQGVPVGEEWHAPGPIITRGVERAAFSPEELQQAVANLGDRFSPEQVRQIMVNLQPGYEEGVQQVRLGAEHEVPVDPVTKQPIPVSKEPLEVERTRQMQANQQPIPTKLPAGEPDRRFAPQITAPAEPTQAVAPHEILPSAVYKAKIDAARARAEARLGGTPTKPTPAVEAVAKTVKETPPQPGNINEDPWLNRETNKITASGVANIYQAERQGELPPIDPNVGVSTEQLIARGSKMGPEEINQHVSDLMNKKGGDIYNQAAAVRIEEMRLTQKARRLSAELSEAQGIVKRGQLEREAREAYDDLADFHQGPVREIKRIFHVAGIGLQGEPGYDLSTYNGLREKFLREVGKNAPPQADEVINRTAERVKRVTKNDYDQKANISNEVDKWTKGKKIDIEEIRREGLKKLNQMPCPV